MSINDKGSDRTSLECRGCSSLFLRPLARKWKCHRPCDAGTELILLGDRGTCGRSAFGCILGQVVHPHANNLHPNALRPGVEPGTY